MIIYRCFVFLIFTIGIFTTKGQSYKFRVFDHDQGLNNPFINTISQDSLGYLWIGTGDGLYRFDGINFTPFTTDHGLKDNFINESYFLSNNLYLGHNNGFISCLNNTTVNTKKTLKVSNSKIITIVPSGDNLCIVSQHGFSILEKRGKLLKEVLLKDGVIINSALYIENNLVLNTTEGIYIYENTANANHRLIYQNDTLGVLNSACSFNEKVLIVSSNYFLLQLEKSSNGFNISKAELPFLSGNENIHHLRQDYQKNLWLSTFGNGILKLDYSKDFNKYHRVSNYNTSNGLNSDYISNTFQDFEGNTWVGTYGNGLVLLQDDFFTFYHDNNDESANNVTAILIEDSVRWTAIDNTLIKTNIIDGTKEKFVFETINNITSLEKTNNIIFTGSEQHGVYAFDRETKKTAPFFNPEDRLSNKTNDLQINEDTVWIATFNGLYALKSNGEFIIHFSTKNGLRHNVINAITLDNKHNIWIGTKSSVLSVLNGLHISEIKLPPNIQLINVTHIQQSTDSSIWLATSGDGIFHITNSSIENISTDKGLLSSYCYALIPIRDESVWVSHKGGLSKLNLTTNRVETFGRESGVGVDFNVHTATKNSSDTEIWFGSKSGIIKYDRTKDSPPFQAPMVDFYMLTINNEEKTITDEIKLPYNSYRVRFDFRGINVAHPEKIKYSYMLEGYEDEWHEYDNTGYAIYSKIEEGTYQFRVISYSGDVFLESVAPFVIKVKKPIWKEWWFYTFLFITICSVFVGIILLMKKRHIEIQKILEVKIEQATKELEEHNKHLTASISYAKNIQDAHFPDHALLKQHLKEYFIFNKPKDIVGGDFYWFDTYSDKLVIAVGDCTGHGVPGGFMTMLAINQLNAIVNERGVTKPSEILNQLHQSIIKSLNAKEKKHTVTDGMDIGICTISLTDNTLQFAGAKRPLLLIRNNNIEIVKGTRKTIGDTDSTPEYEGYTTQYNTNDTFYLFSDGYPDQFGGALRKKFSSQRMYNLITQNQHYSLDQQKIILKNEFQEWSKNFDFQIDDVLVCGFKLN